MKIVKGIIMFIISLLIVAMYFFIYKCNKSYGEKPENRSILRYPRLFLIIPFCGLGLSVISCAYILLFQLDEWQWAPMIFGIVGLPSLIASIALALWKVEIKDDGFAYRNFFGFKAEYNYGDLEYKQSPKGLKWYFYKDNKKVLGISYHIGGEDLLYKKYKKYNKKAANNSL